MRLTYPSSTRAARVVTAVIGGLVSASVLAACGGGGGGASAAPATTTSTTSQRGAQTAAFRQCMADHGVTLPQRTPGARANGGSGAAAGSGDAGAPAGAGAGGSSVGGATPGSGSTRPGGGGFGGRGLLTPPPGVSQQQFDTAMGACQSLLPAGTVQGLKARQAYVSCMGDHGVKVGQPGAAGQPPVTVDRTSAAYKAADAICRPLLPQNGPGGGPAAGGGAPGGGAPATGGN